MNQSSLFWKELRDLILELEKRYNIRIENETYSKDELGHHIGEQKQN